MAMPREGRIHSTSGPGQTQLAFSFPDMSGFRPRVPVFKQQLSGKPFQYSIERLLP